MKCYLFITSAIGGSYPRPKGRELATAHSSTENAFAMSSIFAL